MNTSTRLVRALLPALSLLSLVGLGCTGSDAPEGSTPARTATSPDGLPPVPAGAWKREEFPKGKASGVWVETAGERRRVRVDASVCGREGPYGLECLLCKKGTKEYESILATSANAQVIHTALLGCGGVAGSPVRFEPELKSPTGSVIKVTLEHEDKGQLVSVPAQRWVKNSANKGELTDDWVFAGSMLWPSPEGDDKPKVYAAATDGAYICVTNVPTAMLDLPIKSARDPDFRSFTFYSERIPPKETKVTVILEPVRGTKGTPDTGDTKDSGK